MNCSNCTHGIIKMEDGTILHHGVIEIQNSEIWSGAAIDKYKLKRTCSGKLCMEGNCQCLKPE